MCHRSIQSFYCTYIILIEPGFLPNFQDAMIIWIEDSSLFSVRLTLLRNGIVKTE